jgi:NADP-dependent 3-hydroxy acid dehydrogenase YdfG
MIKDKKIGITGHSSGIGQAIYDYFSPFNEVLGFSRSNGYDLTDPVKYKEVVSILENCDIVINNAYNTNCRFLQTDILNHFIDKNLYDSSKCIVTIGSMSKYVNRNINFNRYASSKVLIEDTLNRIKSSSGHKCGLILISPNWVLTQMADAYKKTNQEDFSKIQGLTTEEIAEQTAWLIDLFYYKNINIYVHEIKKLAV